MKLLTLFSSLSLLASLSPSLATVVPRSPSSDLVDPDADFDFSKRSPEPLPEPVSAEHSAALEERGGGGGGATRVDVKVRVKVREGRPPASWKPDGSGIGFRVDSSGHSFPPSIPHDFQYFGSEIGFAPYKEWVPPPRWRPVEVFVRVWVRVSWWSPPPSWRSYWGTRWSPSWYRHGVPTHWGGSPLRRWAGGAGAKGVGGGTGVAGGGGWGGGLQVEGR